MNGTAYVLIIIIALASVALALFFRVKKQRKPISKLGAVSFGLVIAGIVFSENKWVGYSFIGAGLLLAVADIFLKSKNS